MSNDKKPTTNDYTSAHKITFFDDLHKKICEANKKGTMRKAELNMNNVLCLDPVINMHSIVHEYMNMQGISVIEDLLDATGAHLGLFNTLDQSDYDTGVEDKDREVKLRFLQASNFYFGITELVKLLMNLDIEANRSTYINEQNS